MDEDFCLVEGDAKFENSNDDISDGLDAVNWKLQVNEDASCKHVKKVRHEEPHEAQVDNCMAKKTLFTHSHEGLLRLIKLDLGIFYEKEPEANFKTVDERIVYNIESEELFDPPSKKMYSNIGSMNCGEEKEMGSKRRKTTGVKKDDDDREYDEGDERKKVMGMLDIHLVSAYVY